MKRILIKEKIISNKIGFLKFLISTILFLIFITTSTASAFTDADIIEEWASYAMVSSFIKNWGAAKIIDRSDGGNSYCIDQTDPYPFSYAWVPAHDENNPTQWVRLVYNTPVYPTKVKIIERYKAYDGERNVSKVYFITVSGKKILAWEGDDTQKITWKSQCGGIMELTQDDFTQEARNLTEPVDELLIEFQTHEGSWAGIDAVKLIGYQYRGDIIPQYNGRIVTQRGVGTGEFDSYGSYNRWRALGGPVALNFVSYSDKRWKCEIHTYHSNGPIDIFYKNPVFPLKLRIYEFWAVPGRDEIVKKIYFYTPSGRKVLAWQGNNVTANWKYEGFLEITREDLTSEARNLDEPIIRIRIYVDVSQYGNGDSNRDDWIGIDAVELVGFTEEKEPVSITDENIQDVVPSLPDISISGINDYYYEGQSPQKISLGVNFIDGESSTLYISQEGEYKDVHPDKNCDDELHYTLIQPMQVNRIIVGYRYLDWSNYWIPNLKQVYLVTTEGETVLVWEKNDNNNDSNYYRFYGKMTIPVEAENLTDVNEIIFKFKNERCESVPSVTVIGDAGNDVVTLSVKKEGQVLLNKQLKFDSSQSVDIAIPDSIKNQIASNPGIYVVKAVVGSGDNKKVVTKNFTVKAVNPFIAIQGPDTVDIKQSSSVDLDVNAGVDPEESGYTLSQITYSIPELNITDQPVENGTITIDNLDQPAAEIYHVTVKGCINELEDKCTEVTKTIRFTAPVPEIELTCPSSAFEGENINCHIGLTSQTYTPDELEIEWWVEGGKLENETGTDLSYSFEEAGNYNVRAVVKVKSLPSIQVSKISNIRIESSNISILSMSCIPASGWLDVWTDKRICPLALNGDGSVKFTLNVNTTSLTPVLRIVDADTQEVLKDINISENQIEVKAEDLGFTIYGKKMNLKFVVFYQEIPDTDKRIEKSMEVVQVPPILPEFTADVDDSHEGEATVKISVKDFRSFFFMRYFFKAKGYVVYNLGGKTNTTDSVDLVSGMATVKVTYNREGRLTLYPKVDLTLLDDGEVIKTFSLPSQTITARLPIPITVTLRATNGFEGYAPFTTKVVAYSSMSTWRRTKGLEWILDGQKIAGGPDEVVKVVDLNITEPGEHTLVVKGYHNNSDRVDDAATITVNVLSTPEDVTDAFELKISYNRDKTIKVATGKIYKSNELVKEPVRERLTTLDWVIKDSDGNVVKSGESNLTRWTIDVSDLDLNKNYSLKVNWHTSIGRSFIAEADIDESMIRSHGVDFSKACLRVHTFNSRRQDVYLVGVSSALMKVAGLKAYLTAYDSNGNKITESDTGRIKIDPSSIQGDSYRVKCRVKDSDGVVVWERTKEISVAGAGIPDNHGKNSGNSNRNQRQADPDYLLGKMYLVCQVLDPFSKSVRCVVKKTHYAVFVRRLGYTVDYCISSSDPSVEKVCNEFRTYYQFKTGGEKEFTLTITYNKEGEEENTITKNVTINLPSSLEELLNDPEKGLELEVKIIDPVQHIIKAEANIKDRYYRGAFFKYYYVQLTLLNSNGEELYKPRTGKTSFYYEIPPSTTENYTVKLDVFPKKGNNEVVYTRSTEFNMETLSQNMAELNIKHLTGRNNPWGVYMFKPVFDPTRIIKYLNWDLSLRKDNEEIVHFDNFSRKVFKLPVPGNYTVELKVTSREDPDMVFLTKTYTIEATNEKPQINVERLEATEDRRGNHIVVVYVTPKDPDGRIKKVEISACGYSRRHSRSVLNCRDAEQAEVKITVCDDAGECATETRQVQWVANSE